ncbi:pirin family protein [Vibrio sp. HB161653]|nr:pirin family protein [Vibrio sp. HB161653]MDP5252753.1 pirin family protein [Vibrio sp. HB161653]
MMIIRPAEQRGVGDFGWLKSRHSFSFGQYYDPNHMGFSSLRVINEDHVAPEAGFDTHGHKNMEIISYVIAGALKHRDSQGHEQLLPAGEFQVMSAGKGIYHSEYNASHQAPVHFLQIWIEPNEFDSEPSYQQQAFSVSEGLTVIAGPKDSGAPLTLRQDAWIHQLYLTNGQHYQQSVKSHRHYYVHVVKGMLEIDQQRLSSGDGAKISSTNTIDYQQLGEEPVQVLIFDLV